MNLRIYIFVFLVFGFKVFSQDIDQQYYSNGQSKNFEFKNITSDFGVRRLYGHNFHGGIDFSTGKRDAIVAHSSGKVFKITRDSRSGLIDLIIDGDEYDYAYRHLFDNSSLPIYSNQFILVYVGEEKGSYAIINQRRLDGIATGIAHGKTFNFNNKTYTISNKISKGLSVAPIGNSGKNVPLHLHLQVMDTETSPLNSETGDNQAINPLLYLDYTISNYKVNVNTRDNNKTFKGDKPIAISSKVEIEKAEINGNKPNITYENCLFDIEEVSIQIKHENKIYETLKGNEISTIKYGGNPFEKASPNKILKTGSDYRGSYNSTGVDPYAYDSKAYDIFYFKNFIPIISKNDILEDNKIKLANYNGEALYPDGSYKIRAKAENIKGQSYYSDPIDVSIDNFYPFVKQVLYIYNGDEHYKKKWEWLESSQTLSTTVEFGNKKFNYGDKISFYALVTEPMKNMYLSITELSDTNREDNTYYPMKLRHIPGADNEGLVWELTDFEYRESSGVKQVVFKGEDLNGGGLINDIPNLDLHTKDHNGKSTSKWGRFFQSLFGKSNSEYGYDTNHRINETTGCSITANAGSDRTIKRGETLQLQGSGGGSYSWSPSTGLSNPNIRNPIASPSQTTEYTLTVTANGCSDSDKVTVYVEDDNTGNTPNNDDCSDAISLSSKTSCSKTYGSVSGATGSYGANNCSGSGVTSPDDKDVYYKFTAVRESHTVTVSNFVSNFDAVIELRKACASGSSNFFYCFDPSGKPSEVSYTWDDLNIGQEYYIRVYEYNYGGSPPSSDGFSICVTHEGGGDGNSDEDIYLSDVKVSSVRVKAGDEITVSAKQHYQGSRKNSELPAFDLDYYLSKDCQLSSNDIRIGSDSSTLGSDDTFDSESANVTIPSNTATGNYYILFSADNDQELDEQNEDNNIACVQIEVYEDKAKHPDLEITSLTVTPNKDLSYAEEIEVKMAIANRGESSSGQFKVLVFIDMDGDSEYDENEKLGIIPFESLDGSRGKIKYINFTLPSVFPNNGNYNLFAIADFDNDVNESNEQNNITHVEIQVTEAINYADLHFEIETTNLTCRESKSGSLRVKALNTNYKYSFEVRLASSKITDGALESSNNWEETRTQLTADEYSIHITIDGVSASEFEKIYRIGITEPAPLFVSSGEITSSSSKRYFDIENGTAPFKVFKNGAFVQESYDSHIVIETAHLDVIEVHTAKSCEGIYTEQIFDEVFVLYPNPILNEVNIKMPKGVSNVSPVLFDINGRLIYTLSGNQEKQLLHIPLPSLAKGIYYLKLEPIGKTFKIMKE